MKKLLNEKVTHKKYGMGTIIEESENRITVKFDEIEEKKVFSVPSAFEKFLVLTDDKMQKAYSESAVKGRMEHEQEIVDRLEEIRQMEEQQKLDLAASKKKRPVKVK